MVDHNIDLPEGLVRKTLSIIKVKKSAGPDSLSAMLLKSCKDSLMPIVEYIFRLSINTGIYPTPWKLGKIIPVAKKDFPQKDNDLRPVTLTAILSKCLERVGLQLLMPFVKNHLDPMQFAYMNKRSTTDAVCTLLHGITDHLDRKASNRARALFIDFSSAFNTMQPHKLLQKLNQYEVPAYLGLWVLDYLLNRPQYVQTKTEISDTISLNTGAPQGCVLSPVLFIIYTNDMQWRSDKTFIVKYADDTAIVGLISKDDDKDYLDCIDFVNLWCNQNYLDLNVSKTKEMLWDFRRNHVTPVPVVIDDLSVECVKCYKYLGLMLDDKLNFSLHVDAQIRKANKRVYCFRVMKKLKVDCNIMVLFYNATIASILMYAGAAFYGMLTKQTRNILSKPMKVCKRLLLNEYQNQLDSNENLYNQQLKQLANKIVNDELHPLSTNFVKLPSGRRYRVPRIRTNRFKNTFVPKAINSLNL